MNTKSCYYPCVFGSGMPSSPKIFQEKLVIWLVIWFRIAYLGFCNDYEKLLLCLCVWFWHAQLPQNLQSQSATQWLAGLRKETLKAKWDEKRQESKIYPLKFMSGRFWKGNFERKEGWEKQESKILPSKVHHSKFLKGNFERKGKQEFKIYHPKFIFTSAVPRQVRKTIERIW